MMLHSVCGMGLNRQLAAQLLPGAQACLHHLRSLLHSTSQQHSAMVMQQVAAAPRVNWLNVGMPMYKAVLVDAAGTLLLPSEKTTDVYLRYGSKYGVTLSEDEVLSRFRRYVECADRAGLVTSATAAVVRAQLLQQLGSSQLMGPSICEPMRQVMSFHNTRLPFHEAQQAQLAVS